MACEHWSAEWLDWLSGEDLHVLPLVNLSSEEVVYINELDGRLCRDADEFRKFEVDGFDLGLAVLSSLISQLNEPELDLVD